MFCIVEWNGGFNSLLVLQLSEMMESESPLYIIVM